MPDFGEFGVIAELLRLVLDGTQQRECFSTPPLGPVDHRPIPLGEEALTDDTTQCIEGLGTVVASQRRLPMGDVEVDVAQI